MIQNEQTNHFSSTDKEKDFEFEEISDKLKQKLDSRSDPNDLIQKNIMKAPNIAPSLQATQEAIKFKKTVEKLDNILEKRPEVEDLVEHNILKDNKVAPSLQATQEAIKFQKTQEKIDHKLEVRPTKDELLSHNIMKEQEDTVLNAKQNLEKILILNEETQQQILFKHTASDEKE